MASSTLLPPIVDSYVPAFVVSEGTGTCRFYYSLSKYSSSTSSIQSIHISIVKQNTGYSVVNKVDNTASHRYRNSGIIIIDGAPTPVPDEDNLYYIDILAEDVLHGDDDNNINQIGWKASWAYKIQIRLSTVAYTGNNKGQTTWLDDNANNFSEWSTYCTTKAIGVSTITVPLFKNQSNDIDEVGDLIRIYTLDISTLDFRAEYSNTDTTEKLYSYNLKLLTNTDNLIEDSGIIYTNEYYNPNQMVYLFKTELKTDTIYKLKIFYTTINKYSAECEYKIDVLDLPIDPDYIYPVTIDNVDSITDPDFVRTMKNLTSKSIEEEEGRVVIKLYSDNTAEVSKNICLRRSDSRDNFQSWVDIKIINCIHENVNELPPIFDYTIESGIWYKYGIQIIDAEGYRGVLREMSETILREFEYGYLLGKDGRQLKLKFDNTIGNYIYNYSENKIDTIGGKYPFISRNGAMQYRSFPLNGLISFNMDESETFANDEQLYKYEEIVELYRQRRIDENIHYYDYRRELDFREAVLAFLYDGKPKLFKSPTEGNIIVRLMQISAQPNQTLHRMIYSFTSTAYEIAEATMENYIKYEFCNVGNYISSFVKVDTKRGEIKENFVVGDDLIQAIWNKYQSNSLETLKIKTVEDIKNLKLQFTGPALKITDALGNVVAGNNFTFNNKKFTVINTNDPMGIREYDFDENLLLFYPSDSLIINGDKDNTVSTVELEADFDYDYILSEPKKPIIWTRGIVKNIGQIYEIIQPNDNIYNKIYYKYFFDYSDGKNYLGRISSLCIEAPEGSVFRIRNNITTKDYTIGSTGILNISDFDTNIKNIIYLGDSPINILLDYSYYLIKSTYRRV